MGPEELGSDSQGDMERALVRDVCSLKRQTEYKSFNPAKRALQTRMQMVDSGRKLSATSMTKRPDKEQ